MRTWSQGWLHWPLGGWRPVEDAVAVVFVVADAGSEHVVAVADVVVVGKPLVEAYSD